MTPYFNIHPVCSYCIRNQLSFRASCPVCSVALTDNMLKPNRCLEEVILSFIPIKEYILKTGVSESSSKGKQLVKTSHSNDAIAETEQRSAQPAADLNTSKSAAPTSRSRRMVDCPNCQGSFLQSKINDHLDSCLKTTPFQSRKPMPKLGSYIFILFHFQCLFVLLFFSFLT